MHGRIPCENLQDFIEINIKQQIMPLTCGSTSAVMETVIWGITNMTVTYSAVVTQITFTCEIIQAIGTVSILTRIR